MKTTTIERARIGRRFHALSDETRLQIIELLSGGERCVCELTATLDAAQSRLSYHLKTLKDADLVRDRRQGRWSYYSINVDALDAMAGFLGGAESAEPGTGDDCAEAGVECGCEDPEMECRCA